MQIFKRQTLSFNPKSLVEICSGVTCRLDLFGTLIATNDKNFKHFIDRTKVLVNEYIIIIIQLHVYTCIKVKSKNDFCLLKGLLHFSIVFKSVVFITCIWLLNLSALRTSTGNPDFNNLVWWGKKLHIYWKSFWFFFSID